MSHALRIKQAKLARIAAAQAEAEAQKIDRAKSATKVARPAPHLDITAATLAAATTEPRRRTPAQIVRRAKLARQAIDSSSAAGVAPERDSDGAEATEYQLLLAALGEDLASLRQIQSTEGKIAAKRKMVDAYRPHVLASIEAAAVAGKAVQDEIISTMMLWHIDIGEFDQALDMAEHVLRFGLRLPERFERTTGCVVAEEIAHAALAQIGQDGDFDLAVLQRTQQLTAAEDMPDQVRAKLHKAIGLQLVREADRESAAGDNAAAGAEGHARTAALAELRRAIALAPKVGVKKEIERLTSWLDKQAAPPADGEQDQADN